MDAEKVAKTEIVRDNDYIYYVKSDGVWRVKRKQPGGGKSEPEKIAEIDVEMSRESHIYFLDSDGDVARVSRAEPDKKVAKKKVANKKVANKKVANKADAPDGDDGGAIPY